MYMIAEVSQYVAVASFAEAWIEIGMNGSFAQTIASPPSRRRGLKYPYRLLTDTLQTVASFAEAWIEIVCVIPARLSVLCRLLRGGVD